MGHGDMGMNLGWIRDCWSMFVTNLSSEVTIKDLFVVLQEAGPVFDAFLPKERVIGS